MYHISTNLRFFISQKESLGYMCHSGYSLVFDITKKVHGKCVTVGIV